MERRRREAAWELFAPVLFAPTIGVPVPGGFSLSVTAFTQALGTELLTNPGNPFTFTLDDPDGWTVSGEVGIDPMIHQVGAGEGHLGVGTGYLNFYSSATTNQPRISQSGILTVGQIIEIVTEINLRAAGQIAVGTATSNTTYAAAGLFEHIRRVDNAQALILAAGTAPHDVTVKRFSYKRITPNSIPDAIPLNSEQRMGFTLPVSPVAGQQVGFWFRLALPGTPFTNGNYVYLLRNAANTAWDILTDRYTTNTGTNIAGLSATSVGTPNALRMVASGDSISVYTGTGGIDGAFTQRGSTTTVTQNNTGQYSAPFSSSAAVSGITEFRAVA